MWCAQHTQQRGVKTRMARSLGAVREIEQQAAFCQWRSIQAGYCISSQLDCLQVAQQLMWLRTHWHGCRKPQPDLARMLYALAGAPDYVILTVKLTAYAGLGEIQKMLWFVK